MAFWKLRNAFFLILIPLLSVGQDNPPPNWFNLDYERDGVMGISTEKAYELLLKGKRSTPVVVAVIDGGIDVNHEDLRDVMWINEKDSAATGKDEDGNGYINDKYGWNFIGNANGENVHYDNLEVTRLVRVLEPKYISVLPSTPMSGEERREFQEYQKMVTYYANKTQEARFGQVSYTGLKRAVDTIVARIGKENPTLADFDRYRAEDDLEKMALKIIKKELKDEPDFSKFYEQLKDGVEYFNNQVNYHLNKEYDPRHIVGDDYENSRERYYGNADVTGPDADHGTHVAGIIGAVRDNDIGIKGVADNVRIMAIRTVPDGDERDKDVANSILYAVENGAKVINMSFGKAFAKDKQVVDDAVRFAMENDVLIVHAAGNEGQDNDANPNFPNRNYVDSLGINKGEADAWIEVGASQWKNDGDLVASFSNYGRRSVDVFAPGVKIHSTMPGSTYKDQQGTSMAAPVVAGLAALIRSYYPELPAVEVKRIIMQSVTRVDQRVKVKGPDGQNRRVSMNEVCVTGGVVNAYKALQLAAQQASKSSKKKQ
ncbi:Subtilase family protein [Parapedobacter composti]|uniref:Subtilase family protein n=1 Tax=Parapedobacter composti TaxID=623281 RepID=A0A1I1JAV3_9SPHI|nr:S8 family peptidase [Parapedobacter composti]SFC45586.1 Subtilase family protein [Parapedobacter composti]